MESIHDEHSDMEKRHCFDIMKIDSCELEYICMHSDHRHTLDVENICQNRVLSVGMDTMINLDVKTACIQFDS